MRLPGFRADGGCFRSLRGEAFLPAVFPRANEGHSAFFVRGNLQVSKLQSTSVSHKARFLSRGSFFHLQY
jgi:hypothetical protein